MRASLHLGASVALLATPLSAFAAESHLAVLEPQSARAAEEAVYAQEEVRRFGAEDLSAEGALKDFTRRYRLTLTGGSVIRAASLQVSIDEKPDGSASMTVSVRRMGEIIEDKSFALPDSSYAELSRLTEESGLWSEQPEIWVLRDLDARCAHGRDMVLERLDASGYGLSRAAAGCTSPSGMNAIAFRLVALARLSNSEDWFPWARAL